jgi:hypothetical protein
MFKLQFYKDKSIIAYSLLMTVFALLFVSVELNNEKLYANDFRVYYEATKDFFNGNNPYIHPYGLDTGYFKYPPTTLLFFAPASWFSFSLVKIIHVLLIYLSLLIALPLWQRMISYVFEIKAPKWLLSLGFFVIAIHLTREFHMGNVNVLLLVSFVLGAWFYHKSEYYTSSFFYGMMLILKPIMLLVIVPIVLYRNWKMIGLLTAWGLLFFLGPILIWGWETNWKLWDGWVKSVTSHGEYISNPSSLQFMIPNLLGQPHSWIPSLIGLVLLLIYWFIMDFKDHQNMKSFWFWTVALLGFIPNFFVTDSQHFLLSIPTVLTLVLFISNIKSKIGWILYCLGMLLFSFDSMDLWGRELSTKFTEWGILGIGNLIFISSLLFVRYYFRSFFRANFI